MQRRDFIKGGIVGSIAAAEAIGNPARGAVRAHNWDKYDFGGGPVVRDRLNQGPFPQYAPDAAIPSDEVVMTTIPTDEVVPHFGKGLVTYITADMGTEEIKSDNVSREIQDLVELSPRSAHLPSPYLARGAAAAGKTRSARIFQAGTRPRPEE